MGGAMCKEPGRGLGRIAASGRVERGEWSGERSGMQKNGDAQRPEGDIERVTREESSVGKHLPVTTAAATAAGVTSGTASVATGILTCCGRSEAGWQVWASHCLCVCLNKCR